MEHYDGTKQATAPVIIEAPRCRKCGTRAGHKFYMAPDNEGNMGLVALAGWCDCAERREGLLKFPDWVSTYLGQVSTVNEPIPTPPHAHVVLACRECRGPIVSTYRWIVRGNAKWWAHGAGLCSCGEKKAVADILADWKALVRTAPGQVGDAIRELDAAFPLDAPAVILTPQFNPDGPPEFDPPEA